MSGSKLYIIEGLSSKGLAKNITSPF